MVKLLEHCSKGSIKKKWRIHHSVAKSALHQPKYVIIMFATAHSLVKMYSIVFKKDMIAKPDALNFRPI